MNNFWHDLPQPFFVLAPMEAVTDVVFRHVVARAGAPDIYFTEFTNATGWVHAGEKAIGGRLLKTDDEQPIVAQRWGGEPGDMEQLAAHCRELGYHGIDINMGCPAKSAIKSGGSALIRNPELAAQAIAAAKTAGLPVSVKTRLGYTRIDEWHDWLAHLLRQDIVNLTIHLRTKKEMSKVPAHHELIPDIIALRDELAPHTLLTINGDIEDRAHGLDLIAKYPGINGVMIGRGVFHNPFCFKTPLPSSQPQAAARRSLLSGPAGVSAPEVSSSDEKLLGAAPHAVTRAGETVGEPLPRVDSETSAQTQESAEGVSRSTEDCLSRASSAGTRETTEADSWRAEAVSEAGRRSGDGESNGGGRRGLSSDWMLKQVQHDELRSIDLLNYHLDLFDQYQGRLHRPFETLKRFFKIYIRDFDGAADLRDQLMHTKSTDEVRAALAKHK